MSRLDSSGRADGGGVEAIALSSLSEGLNSRFAADGTKLVIVRDGADVGVFGETCPHMGADLGEATYCSRSKTLRCKWHGYQFEGRTGAFVANPNEKYFALLRTKSPVFDPDKTPRYRLPKLHHWVEGDKLFVELPKSSSVAAGSTEVSSPAPASSGLPASNGQTR